MSRSLKLPHDSCEPVQCRICWRSFHSLANHLKRQHGINAKDYRRKFRVTKRDMNCSDVKAVQSSTARRNIAEGKIATDKTRSRAPEAARQWRNENRDILKENAKKASDMGEDARREWFDERGGREIAGKRMKGLWQDPNYRPILLDNIRNPSDEAKRNKREANQRRWDNMTAEERESHRRKLSEAASRRNRDSRGRLA